MINLSLMALLSQPVGLPPTLTPVAPVAPSLSQAEASPRPARLSFAIAGGVFAIAPIGGPRQSLLQLPAADDAPLDELAWSIEGMLAVVYGYAQVLVQDGAGGTTAVFTSRCPHLPTLDLAWAAQGQTLFIKEQCQAPASASADTLTLYVAEVNDAGAVTPARRLSSLPSGLTALSLSPDGSQAAYVQGDRIYRRALNRNQAELVTPQPGIYGAAGSPLAWSPDGSQLAFFEGRYPNQRIYVTAVEGGEPKLLTPEPDFQIYRSRLYWSPDSRQLLFYQPANPPYGNEEIVQLVTIATGEIKPLTRPGFYDGLSWSPNSRQLVLASGKIENQGLFLLDLATAAFTPLTPEPIAQVLQSQWSPDGSWIAFSAEPAGQALGNQILYSVRPDGSELQPLTSPEEYVYPFSWQP